MSKREINKKKIVVFSGAGVSVESGIPAFRFDSNSLWNNHDPNEVATYGAWKHSPERVIGFVNDLKAICLDAEPNEAHKAIAALEEFYEVVVITTNLDNLHERAGSTNVIHIHGDITKARSQVDDALINKKSEMIKIGELCEHGEQIRPDIVLFGEEVCKIQEAKAELKDAGRVIVVGTSLSVKPASGIPKAARGRAIKVLINPAMMKVPYGFRQIPEKATRALPRIASRWIDEAKNQSN